MRKVAVLALLTVAGVAGPSMAVAQEAPKIEVQKALHVGEFHVPVNKSLILRLDTPFTDLLVGNQAIADVLALTNKSLYVLGKAPGSTDLTIYGPHKQLIAVVDIVVGFDVEGLKAKLRELLPDENIEVR